MNPNKVDMTSERTPRQWNILLDTIKRNDSNVLTKDEQSYYIEAIEISLLTQVSGLLPVPSQD